MVTLPRFWSRNVSPALRLAGMMKSSINFPVAKFKVELKTSVEPFGYLEVMLTDMLVPCTSTTSIRAQLTSCPCDGEPVHVTEYSIQSAFLTPTDKSADAAEVKLRKIKSTINMQAS